LEAHQGKYCGRTTQGRIQDFKLGEVHLKKLRRAEGGAKNVGVFRVKNHDFTPKKITFFPILGGARRVRPPPLDLPLQPTQCINGIQTFTYI
jgi:hypothetical protein